MSRLERFIRRNSSTILLALGIGLVADGSFVRHSAAVAVSLVVLGVAAGVLGPLLPRLRGRLDVGPHGLSAFLSEPEAEATDPAEHSPLQRSWMNQRLRLGKRCSLVAPGTDGTLTARQLKNLVDELVVEARTHRLALPPH